MNDLIGKAGRVNVLSHRKSKDLQTKKTNKKTLKVSPLHVFLSLFRSGSTFMFIVFGYIWLKHSESDQAQIFVGSTLPQNTHKFRIQHFPKL